MADEKGFVDKEKKFYLTQIRYLEEQLERHQRRREELEEQNRDLASRYSAMEEDMKEVTAGLKCSAAAREKEAEELLRRLERRRRAAALGRGATTLQHGREMEALRGRAEELRAEILSLRDTATNTKEQLVRRLSHTQALQQELTGQNRDLEAAVRSQREAVQEHKTRMSQHVQSTVDACLRTGVSDALRRERAQLGERSGQLRFLKDKSAPLRTEGDVLRDRDRELRATRDDLRKELKEITQERSARRAEEEQLREQRRRLTAELRDWDVALRVARARAEPLGRRLAAASEALRRHAAAAEELGVALRREKSRSERLGGARREAAAALRRLLPANAPRDPQEESPSQRRMRGLLRGTPEGAASTRGAAPSALGESLASQSDQ